MATPATAQPATTPNTGQPGSKPVQPAVASGPGGAVDLPVVDADIASKKQQKLLDLALKQKLLDEEQLKKLSETDRKCLGGLTCAENNSGALTVFGDNGKPIADMNDHCINFRPGGATDSDENIKSLLQTGVLVHAKFGDSCCVDGSDPLTRLMLTKACELAGSTVKNKPAAGETLDDKYPEIARRMEQQWAIMHGQKPAPGFDNAPVAEIKAKDLADVVKSGKPLLLEVTSENCQWCAKEKPEIARIAAQTGGKVQVASIDINELNDYVSHLDDKDPLKKKLTDILHNEDNRFGVPAIGVFENGDLKNMKVGYQTADQVRQFANGNLSADNALPTPSAAAAAPAAPRPANT